MTRETKIGLLVGLAFIIVIGILLSDHLTSSTEPPQATLANAGSSVRSGVTTPGSAGPQLTVAAPPISTAPQQQVATQSELAPRPDPVSIIKVGPSNNPTNASSNTDEKPVQITLADPGHRNDANTPNLPQIPAQNASDSDTNNDSVNTKPQVIEPNESAPTITRAPDTGRAAQINAVGAAHGEEVVALDSNGRAIPTNTNTATNTKTGMVDYKVEAGDSLSKIASKVMGTNSKANRDAIIAANASLKENPDRIIVGRTYHVPTVANAAAPKSAELTPKSAITMTEAAPDTNTATSVNSTKVTAKTEARASGEYWYTVKPGDSLWRIASDQCGNAGAIDAIKELNKASLKGDEHDVVIVGSKLKLPTKPVASAS